MLTGTGTLVVLPILGLLFALLFYFVFDESTITKRSPRINALVRIVFAVMWMIASTFILLVVGVVLFFNWLIFQLILGRKDWKGMAEPVIDFWLGWTKVILYGYS